MLEGIPTYYYRIGMHYMRNYMYTVRYIRHNSFLYGCLFYWAL